MKNILILEDNKNHLEALAQILEGIEDVKIFQVSSVKEAYEMLLYHDFKVFLIDIILDTKKLGDVSGIDFVKQLRDNRRYKFTPVIFITALEDPYLSAFKELHCYAYIEKPFQEDYVIKTVKEALEFPVAEDTDNTVFFRKEGVLYSVKTSDITHIIVSRAGVNVHTIKGCLRLPYKPIPDLLSSLNSTDFIQCSRSAIVNKTYIDNVDLPNRYVKLKGEGECIEIGSIMKKYFRMEL